MKKGVTPIHYFDVDLDCTDAEVLYIYYAQGRRVLIEKSINDVEITPEQLSTRLTQAETLLFKDGIQVKMQIRVRFPDGSAFITDVMYANVDEILKGGVI